MPRQAEEIARIGVKVRIEDEQRCKSFCTPCLSAEQSKYEHSNGLTFVLALIVLSPGYA